MHTQPTFLFDRSMPPTVGRALKLVRPGGEVELHDDHFPPGTKDPALFEELGVRNWAWVTRDNAVKRRPREMQAILDTGIRAYFLANTQNLKVWDVFEILVRRWSEIVAHASSNVGPSLVGVRRQGAFEPVELRGPAP